MEVIVRSGGWYSTGEVHWAKKELPTKLANDECENWQHGEMIGLIRWVEKDGLMTNIVLLRWEL